MKPLLVKVRPRTGYAELLHIFLLAIFPLIIFILVRLQFVQLSLSLIVLSKWRMFAVRPRFWVTNIRANAVDIMVGLSIVLFMINSGSVYEQLFWAVIYGVWLILIKPASGLLMTSIQAFLGQLSALSALYLVWAGGPLYGLTAVSGLICYLSARHFFDSYEENYAKLLSYIWGYFGSAVSWLLAHWLLYYSIIAQPTLLLSVIGYGLAALYFLDHTNKLTKTMTKEIIFVILAIIIVVLSFSDWGNKIV